MLNSKHLDVDLLLHQVLWLQNGLKENLWVFKLQITLFASKLSFLFCVKCFFSSLFKIQLDDAGKIKNADIAAELCLPPVKLHCSSKYSKSCEKNEFVFNLIFILIDSAGWGCYQGSFERLQSKKWEESRGCSWKMNLLFFIDEFTTTTTDGLWSNFWQELDQKWIKS